MAGFIFLEGKEEYNMYKNSAQRFREIVKVLAKYGFGYIIEPKKNKEKAAPQNLRKAFEELGPTFVKIGQIISTRPDILPEAYIEELSKLQDSVAPESFEVVNSIFYEEFSKNIHEVFDFFDIKPMASASMAQVHRARMKSGEEVIVKIQRPHIKELMELDLSILLRLAKLTKSRFQDFLIDPVEAVRELMDSTSRELNFLNEVNNIKKFHRLNRNTAVVKSPRVYEEYSSSRVVTMERIHGFKVDDINRLKKGGYDLNDLAKKLVLSFFKQVFEDNFFHGDPHPGNIMISDGKICYIDFGIMGTLSDSIRQALNDMIIAAVYKDIDKLIAILMTIGIKTGYVNRNRLYEDIDYLLANYFGTSLSNIKISFMLEEVFQAARRNNIKLPKDITLLMRSLIIFEGVVAKINPDFNLTEVAVPYVKNKNKFKFLKDIKAEELLARSLSFSKELSELPGKIGKLSDSILNGRAKIQMEFSNLQKSVNDFNNMVDRLVAGLILSAMIIGSSLILNSNVGPKLYGISIIGFLGYGIAAVIGLWLVINMIRARKL